MCRTSSQQDNNSENVNNFYNIQTHKHKKCHSKIVEHCKCKRLYHLSNQAKSLNMTQIITNIIIMLAVSHLCRCHRHYHLISVVSLQTEEYLHYTFSAKLQNLFKK